MKYICCTDPNSAPSILGTNLKKQPCSGHGLAQDITADRKGWAAISAGAALGLQMPLWSYMEMTKTRCNSLIFLSCLLFLYLNACILRGGRFGFRTRAQSSCPTWFCSCADTQWQNKHRVSEEDDIRITSSVKGDRAASHRWYLHV